MLERHRLGGAWGVSLAAGIFGLIVFWIAAPWDPDPHHDGFQFAVAVGVRDGHAIYRGVFDQYGPVTGWLQAGALAVFGSRLVVLRYEIAVVLAIAAAQVAWLIHRHTRSAMLALLVSVAWIGACPIWASYPGMFPLWPWPSAVLAVLVLGSVIAFDVGREGRRAGLVVSGALVAMAVFTRWPSGLAVIPVFVVCIVWFEQSGQRWQAMLPWATGLVAAAACCTLPLLATSALKDAVYQTVTQPFNIYTAPSDAAWFKLYYGYGSVAIVVIAVGAGVLFLGRLSLIRIAGALLAGGAAWIVWTVGTSPQPAVRAVEIGVPDRFVGAADVLGESVILVAAVATPIVALVVLASGRGYRQRIRAVAPLGGAALTALIQLYPIADVYHLWWAMPVCVTFLGVVVGQVLGRRLRHAWFCAVVVLAPFLLLNLFGFHRAATASRVTVASGVLSGMKVPEARFPSVGVLDDMLLRGPGAQSHEYLCRDGLVSVYRGVYGPDTAAFVDWAWLRPGVAGSSTSEYVVLCAPDSATGRAMAATWHRRVIAESPTPVALSPWSGFSILVLGPAEPLKQPRRGVHGTKG